MVIQNIHLSPQEGVKAFTPSSLLIPSHLLLHLSRRSTVFKGTKHYFKHLIVTYARHLSHYGFLAETSKWKKEYQKPGLNLHKKNFKPCPILWEEFRHISFAYGVAMCRLFTILIELEYSRWVEAGSPEDFCEQPPLSRNNRKFGMNSTPKLMSETLFRIEKILQSQNGSLLIRNIDFGEPRLDRYCIIH